MLLNLVAAFASFVILLLSLGMIGHMLGSHWRQIRMALNAEIALRPDPTPPVPLVRPEAIQLTSQTRRMLRPELPIAA